MAATPPPIPENRRKKPLQESSFSPNWAYPQLSLKAIRNVGLVLIVAWASFLVFLIHDRYTDVDYFFELKTRVPDRLEAQGFKLVNIVDAVTIHTIYPGYYFIFEKDNYGDRVQIAVHKYHIGDLSGEPIGEVHRLPEPVIVNGVEVDSYIGESVYAYFNTKQ